jgi:hypothetical protein
VPGSPPEGIRAGTRRRQRRHERLVGTGRAGTRTGERSRSIRNGRKRDRMKKLMRHKAYLMGVVVALAIAGAQVGTIVGTCGFKWGG